MKSAIITTGIIAGVGTVGYVGFRAYRKKEAAENLIVDISKMGMPRLEGEAVVIPVEVFLRNSYSEDLSIQYPVVKLSFQGQDVGISEPQDSKLLIPKNSDVKFNLNFRASKTDTAMNLFQIGKGVFDSVKNLLNKEEPKLGAAKPSLNPFAGKTLRVNVITAYMGFPISIITDKTF